MEEFNSSDIIYFSSLLNLFIFFINSYLSAEEPIDETEVIDEENLDHLKYFTPKKNTLLRVFFNDSLSKTNL